jgi:hypothetical protein
MNEIEDTNPNIERRTKQIKPSMQEQRSIKIQQTSSLHHKNKNNLRSHKNKNKHTNQKL